MSDSNQTATIKDIHKAITQANYIANTLELENQRLKYLLDNLKLTEQISSQRIIMQELTHIMAPKEIYVLYGLNPDIINSLTVSTR